MKILILSDTPWDDSNSFGSSFSNIFSGIDNIEIANIYCRSGAPENKIVKKYFQITEKSLLANLKNSSVPSGNEIFVEEKVKASTLNDAEQKAFDSARRKRWQIAFWARDTIWTVGRWCSPQLKAFIDDFHPDLIFQPIYYSNYLSNIALFIKKYTGAPMVGYISDDCYTLRQFSVSPLYWLDRFHKRRKVKKVFMSCEFVYVISEIQKQEYEKIFGKPCYILTKCADFSAPPAVKPTYNTPLEMIYTGNLGNDRWKSLAKVATALAEINKPFKTPKAIMKIYSATPLNSKQIAALDDEKNSFFMGAVASSEVEMLQRNADILLYAEGFSLKSRLEVHQSFSTKIVDYLHMARPIFALGARDTASIDYFITNDAAVTAANDKEVYVKLSQLLNEHSLLDEYSLKGYESGKRNHESSIIKRELYNSLTSVTGKH